MTEDWLSVYDKYQSELSTKVDSIKINPGDKSKCLDKSKSPEKEWPDFFEEKSDEKKTDGSINTTPTNSSQTTVDTPKAEKQASNQELDETPTSPADVSLINKLLRTNLVTSKHDIEILQRDPKSPLYSVKTFEKLNLRPELLRGIYDMGFNAPSKIQETALPALLANPPTNMIAQSQSGTGKTAAFVLTMLSRIDTSAKYAQCLCLAPTYELALQIGEVAKQMAKHIPDLQIGFAIRGNQVTRRVPVTQQVIIGTPGTLLDWCFKYLVVDLKRIKVFVLDEADVMIDKQGHLDQSVKIHSQLSPSCQMLLFSATYDDIVMQFAHRIIPNPTIIRLRREEESLDNIKQYFIEVRSLEDKYTALANIYGAIVIGQSMVFCHTRRSAAWLATRMKEDGHNVGLLSGDLVVEQRASVISRFKSGKERVLISTNVTARGIDVESVTVVVNFDLPVDMQGRPDYETYLHRIGRTGRFGKTGLAINMVDSPASMQILSQIEKHFERKIEKLNADDLDEIEKISGQS